MDDISDVLPWGKSSEAFNEIIGTDPGCSNRTYSLKLMRLGLGENSHQDHLGRGRGPELREDLKRENQG